MGPAGLHSLTWDAPDARFEVDLVPRCQSDLSGSRSRENQEFQGACGDALPCSKILHERPDLVPRKRRMVHDRSDLRRVGQRMLEIAFPSCRIFTISIAADSCPRQDSFNPLPDPRSRFGLLFPDSLQYTDDVRELDLRDGQLAYVRVYVPIERIDPILAVLLISESGDFRLVTSGRSLRKCQLHCLSGNQSFPTGSPLLDRIFASKDKFSGSTCALTSHCQSDIRISTQADIPALAPYSGS